MERKRKKNAGNGGMLSRRDFLGKGGAAVAAMGLASPLVYGATADEPFRIALIGAGGRMSALLGTVLQQSNVEIVACIDILPKNLNAKLDRIEKATGKRPEGYTGEKDYVQILRRDDIHGALSACPCDLHAPIYLEALHNHKHMYGEKPACLTVQEGEDLVVAQKESKSILQIGFQRRVNPRYIEGIKLIHGGEIGDPVESRAAWNNSGGPLGVGRWLNYRARSGDWMLEQACHTWDVLAWVAGGPPSAAYGIGRRDVYSHISSDRDVTDYYIAALEYPNGLYVNFNHTWSAPRNDKGAFSGVYERIAGSKGGIDLGAGRISYTDRNRMPRLIEKEHGLSTPPSVQHYFDCVRMGATPASTITNGVIATHTGLLVRKAVDENRRVTIDEILET